MTMATAKAARIFDFKLFQKNTLKAFFSVELPSGLIIHGCTLHEKNGARWIGLPSRKFEKDGKEGYAPIIEFRDRACLDKFRDAILEAIDAQKPAADANAGRQTPSAPDPPPNAHGATIRDEDIPF